MKIVKVIPDLVGPLIGLFGFVPFLSSLLEPQPLLCALGLLIIVAGAVVSCAVLSTSTKRDKPLTTVVMRLNLLSCVSPLVAFALLAIVFVATFRWTAF